jgi:signal transduction histidine kinase
VSLRGYLLWLVLVATLPALVFSAWLIYKSADERRGFVKEEVADATEILAREVDAQLRQTVAALEVLALSNVLARDDLGGFYQVAQRVLRSHADWANVVLVSPQGEHLVNLNVPYGAALPPLSRPEVFLASARSRSSQVSNTTLGVTVKRLLTVVAVPVMRDDEVKYVLGVAQQAGNWDQSMRDRLPHRMHATLLDREYTIVARTLDNERFAGKKPARPFLDGLARDPERGELQGVTLEGFRGYGYYRRLPFSGWTIAVFTPVETFDEPMRAVLGQLGAGFLLLIAATLVIAWVLGRQIAAAIGSLTASMHAVGNGGYPLPVDARIREVGEANQALENAAQLLAGRLSREQAARAEIEAADRAKDEYLAMLAHELRNPLAPINAALFILAEEPLSSEAARRARTVLGRQAQHLGRLVDDLLDVTRLASGKVELHSEAVSVDEVLRQSVEDHAELAAKANVELALEVPERPVLVHGDRTRLAQIAGNLLQNAVRFTPAGGRVTVSLERHGAKARISVRDTGTGIEPQLLPRLFEPFVQGGHVATRARGGLGLGLALVKGLAELHDGRVEAFSAGPGHGAEFVVTLPALADR